jgi:hypothetical protein
LEIRAPLSQHLPCYAHLKCDRVGDHGKTPGACLEWREICDGKVDCIDGGHDEEQCWQLEINECDRETEFRCHNGLCIPLIFLNDDERNADCLDRTDKLHIGDTKLFWPDFPYPDINCHMDPASRCEDHMCRPTKNREYTVDCGDGECVNPFASPCVNMRDLLLIDAFCRGMNASDVCRSALYCIIRLQMDWEGFHYQMIKDCDMDKYDFYTTRIKEH